MRDWAIAGLSLWAIVGVIGHTLCCYDLYQRGDRNVWRSWDTWAIYVLSAMLGPIVFVTMAGE